MQTSYDLSRFYTSTLPNYFTEVKKEYKLLNYNILLKDSFIISIKKNNLNKNYAFSDQYGIKQLDYNNLESTWNHFENRTSFNLNSTYTLEYSYDKSYLNQGSYVYNYNLNSQEISTDVKKMLFDPLVTKSFIEAYLINYEYDNIISLVFDTTISEGNIINSHIIIDIINLNSTTIFFKITLSFDILFVIFLIYFIIDFILRIKQLNNAYEKWHYENITYLSTKTQMLRQYFSSEFIRKLTYICNFFFFVDSLIIIISIIYIIVKIMIYMKAYTLSDLVYNYLSSTSIFALKYKISNVKSLNNYLLYIISVLLNAISFRLLFMINFGRFFGIITNTLRASSNLLFIFLFLLMLCQPAFVCSCYIAFGWNVIDYSTWSSSFINTLITMFGTFDPHGIIMTHASLGSIIFYLYLTIINVILINLFVATLDRAYKNIKEKIKLIAEEYEFRYAFFFCCYKKKVLYNESLTSIDHYYEKDKISIYSQQLLSNLISGERIGFNDTELMNLVIIEDKTSEEINKWKLIEYSYLSYLIGGASSVLEHNLFKEIKPKHKLTSGVFILSYFDSLIRELENNKFTIERYDFQLKQFILHQEYKVRGEVFKIKNNQILEEINDLEILFSNELEEIQKYQELNIRINQVDIINDDDYISKHDSDSMNSGTENIDKDKYGIDSSFQKTSFDNLSELNEESKDNSNESKEESSEIESSNNNSDYNNTIKTKSFQSNIETQVIRRKNMNVPKN